MDLTNPRSRLSHSVGSTHAYVGSRARRRRRRRARGRSSRSEAPPPQAQQARPAADSITRTGHHRHRIAEGPAPADLLPPRHPRRPVQDPVPVLPLLGGGLARAGHSRRCRPAWGAIWSWRAATARPRPRSRRCARPGPRRSRSSGSACTSLARHAHFPHQRHIKALGPNACATCHGDVSRMPQVFKVNNVNNMGFCITLPRRAERLARLLGVPLLKRRAQLSSASV